MDMVQKASVTSLDDSEPLIMGRPLAVRLPLKRNVSSNPSMSFSLDDDSAFEETFGARRTSYYREDDMVILVMGPTGSGKSSFIRNATMENVEVNHGLKPCTNHVRAYRCRHPDNTRNVVLVDTPGIDEIDVLPVIQSWLEGENRKNVKFAGILYLHRISDGVMPGSIQRSLESFARRCQDKVFPKILLATTMWDMVDYEDGLYQEKILRDKFWKKLVIFGSKICRVGASPWEIIQEFTPTNESVLIRGNAVIAIPEVVEPCRLFWGSSLWKWFRRLFHGFFQFLFF